MASEPALLPGTAGRISEQVYSWARPELAAFLKCGAILL